MAALEDNSATTEENPQEPESQPPEVEPKRGRGRSKESVDKAPRKRTKIIQEAVEPPPPPPPPAPPTPAEPVRMMVRRATPAPAPTPAQAPPAAPPSPRTLFKQATETIHQMQTQREHARRDYWAEQISKSLR